LKTAWKSRWKSERKPEQKPALSHQCSSASSYCDTYSDASIATKSIDRVQLQALAAPLASKMHGQRNASRRFATMIIRQGEKMKLIMKCLMASALASTLAACTTTGVGTGQLTDTTGQDEAASFTWISHDGGNSGDMTALLQGKSYQGRFFQITSQTVADTLTASQGYWRHGWYDGPYLGAPIGGAFPSRQFVTHYSGKVMGMLDAADNHARCQFHLAEPAHGLSSGGQGECQLSGGGVVYAHLLTDASDNKPGTKSDIDTGKAAVPMSAKP
jgi:hypothetical protein